jgi:hypothetical protein
VNIVGMLNRNVATADQAREIMGISARRKGLFAAA